MTTTLIESDNARDIRTVRWIIDGQRACAVVVNSTHVYRGLARASESWSARSYRPLYDADRDIQAGSVRRFDTMTEMLQSLK